MRTAAIATFAVVAAATAALWAPATTEAKIFIEVSPTAGAPGSVVHVHGIGFQPGDDARIELRAATGGPGFATVAGASELPEAMLLATVRPNEQYEINADVTLPSAVELAEAFGDAGSAFEIIAIGTNDQIEGLFVASTAFTVTSVTAPAAGASASVDSGGPDLPVRAGLASLGVAGAVLLATGWRLRRQEAARADTAHRGPTGP